MSYITWSWGLEHFTSDNFIDSVCGECVLFPLLRLG